MRVLSLELANFRNYTALRFDPPAGACVFVGPNAQGKSNLLEALGLLSTGKSFRTMREADMVRAGTPAANVTARVRTKHGEVQASCIITIVGDGSRKRFLRNGRAVAYGEFLGGIAAVTFSPFDLAMITGAAALRRRLINAALSQDSRSYYRDLVGYAKVLAQKNALLRSSGLLDHTLLETYNEQLVETGSRIVLARTAYVRRLGQESAAIHSRWVGGQTLRVSYKPAPMQGDESPSAIAKTLRTGIMQALPAEIARKVALVGPHRDDLELSLDDQPLARFGSQGQQRTAVLAVKAAEYLLLYASAGEAPLLLLDDVLSELDAQRRKAVLETLGDYDQAFITATETPDLPAAVSATALTVHGGAIEPMRAALSA